MRVFEIALIVAVTFGAGTAVGLLFVMALPTLARARAYSYRKSGYPSAGSWRQETPDQLRTGPLHVGQISLCPPYCGPDEEPDDRDENERPWWSQAG